MKMRADMVVLATGMVPASSNGHLPLDLDRDAYGFCAPEQATAGITAAGTAKTPTDVSTTIQDATGAALEAIQVS